MHRHHHWNLSSLVLRKKNIWTSRKVKMVWDSAWKTLEVTVSHWILRGKQCTASSFRQCATSSFTPSTLLLSNSPCCTTFFSDTTCINSSCSTSFSWISCCREKRSTGKKSANILEFLHPRNLAQECNTFFQVLAGNNQAFVWKKPYSGILDRIEDHRLIIEICL